MQKEPIIILGCHRSGTTLLSKIASKLGVYLGSDLNRHHESTFFLNINQQLLNSSGGSWDRPGPFLDRLHSDPGFERSCCDMVRNKLGGLGFWKSYWGPTGVLNSMIGGRFLQFWGWKDPRNTITLPVWRKIYPNLKVISIERNGIDVAISLHKREMKRPPDSLFSSDYCRSIDNCYQVWQNYQKCLASFKSVTNGHDRLNLDYEQLTSKPSNSIAHVSQFLGLPANGKRVKMPRMARKMDSRKIDYANYKEFVQSYSNMNNTLE